MNETDVIQMTDWPEMAALLVVLLLAGGALWGFFRTKKDGFGRYNTSVLTVLLVLSFGTVALVLGLMREQAFSGLLMAVVGFAGGMVVGKEQS